MKLPSTSRKKRLFEFEQANWIALPIRRFGMTSSECAMQISNCVSSRTAESVKTALMVCFAPHNWL